MGQTCHSWVMIDSLIALHFLNNLRLQAGVGPIKIPVKVLILTKLIIKLAAALFDNSVLGLESAKDKFLSIFLLLRLFIYLISLPSFFCLGVFPFLPDFFQFFLDDFMRVVCYNQFWLHVLPIRNEGWGLWWFTLLGRSFCLWLFFLHYYFISTL